MIHPISNLHRATDREKSRLSPRRGKNQREISPCSFVEESNRYRGRRSPSTTTANERDAAVSTNRATDRKRYRLSPQRERERERERKKRRNATEANDTSPQANSLATRARLGTTLPVLN
uniref:Uncharacterized protein n=1 Tax=Brassica campestris TaxID=3711 RepID=M4EZW6_BRACM